MPLDTQEIVDKAVEQELADLRHPKKPPRWLFDTLKDSKLALTARTRAATKRDQGNCVAHALVARACDEEPVCHKDAFSNDLWMQAMQA